MVSFQTPISSSCINKVPEHEKNLDQSSSNKRKVIDNYAEKQDQSLFKKSKPALSLHSSGLGSRMESLLETPMPLDWQQCLDIQSGKVHFYNTRTETRTSKDPREGGSSSLELSRSRSAHMRLDLELNLPCDDDSSEPNITKLHTDLNSNSDEESHNDLELNFGNNDNMKSSTAAAPSWLAYEGDEKSEMVATVCKRCFMLVMLCKASPACPNCKFMHSHDQSAPAYIFKRSFTQLLY